MVTHGRLVIGDDLPVDKLHVLVAGQGDADAGVLQPVGERGDRVVNSLPIPLSPPARAGGAGD